MKKIILPCIFGISTLFSCSNDDNSSSDASIVGSWNLVKYQTQFSKDKRIVDSEIADACSSKSTFTFTSDNKYNAISYYSYNSICDVDDTVNGVYSISGKKITIKYEDWSGNAEIIKLTSNELIMSSDYGEDLDGDGVNEIDIIVLKK